MTVITTSNDTQPIVACCTARGSGAIALIRLSGIGALMIGDRIAQLPSGMLISTVPTHTIHYGFVADAHGNKIDTVLFLVMQGPRTFTGQDTVEITVHNNIFLINAIIDSALTAGARLAEPGEFSKRAVLAGKMDLIQAEALHEFIQAGTMQSLKASYAQLSGNLSREVVLLEKKLLHTLSLSNASFEFIEEEGIEFGISIRILIAEIRTDTNRLLAQIPLQKQLKEGTRIALVGSVNAGKSSLFNAILGVKRAIVTPIAGTTRDVIESHLYRHGEHHTLIDTAGIRATDDIIEQHGIERSEQEAAHADIVIVVIDSTRSMCRDEMALYNRLIAAYPQKTIIASTKIDLPAGKAHGYTAAEIISVPVSIHRPDTIAQLMTTIDTLRATKIQAGEMTYLLNERQIRLLQELAEKLDTIEATIAIKIEYEIFSHHVQDALATLSELTGKSVLEASMDTIFKEFCIGK